MSQRKLFKWLETLSKLGSPGYNSLDHVDKLLAKLKEEGLDIKSPSASTDAEQQLRESIQTSVSRLLSNVDEITKSDIRVVYGCYVVVILHEIHQDLSNSPAVDDTSSEDSVKKAVDTPLASPNLISIQQTKVAEDALRLVVYTLMLGCLSSEASQYIKLMVARKKFVVGPNLVAISPTSHHGLLASLMKVILKIFENASLGNPLRGPLFPEILSVLLELCFAPGKVKNHHEDTAYFREQLEQILSSLDANQTLQHLLLLKGIAKNGGWLQKVCGSFIVRRYMMQPNGVAAVIGAGLIICDGQDWKRCEAVAALVSHAKYPNIDEFYSAVGPQISALMVESSLKPDILRVVMLIVSELVQRSATLTAIHITNALIQPLLNITSHQITSPMTKTSLTVCVSRIHKLFVEIGLPSGSLMSLLRPVIDPLVVIAAFPASHLRSLAQQCVARFLSQQSLPEAVKILLHVCRVNLVPEIPTTNSHVSLSLDDEGGLWVDLVESCSQEKVLENDENLAKVLIKILEELNDPDMVRSFYDRLVSFIDFSVLNRKETSSTLLVTDSDIKMEQFEAIRKIYICCSLLSNLSDNEKLTDDLFKNLSAATPIVVTLLKTSCQKCEDEDLDKTRLTFMLNVIMMVSCHVNEQVMRKKMSSEDWKSLKWLLPSLEEIKKTITDNTILLFVEQLRNTIMTRGVITSDNQNELKIQVDGSVETDKNPNSSTSNNKLHLSTPANLKRTCKVDNKQVNSCTQRKESDSCTSSKQVENSSCKKYSYSEAMKDVISPLLPVRGHGLLALGKLVEERDSETLSHKDQLLILFQHGLKDDDSYLYLMAIQGLAVLCDASPEKIVDILTHEFGAGNRSPEDRAKLAEALARASKRLGPILPHYKSEFINCLLSGVRDTESIVRTSSLSSLGEVCKILRFSLGSIIFEVFAVLQNVVDTDEAVEVRRAAILVVTLILQGLGRDTFSVLKDVIRDLYRVLRLVHNRDTDDVVRLHTQLAIEEIDNITKEFLLPKLSLTKRIYVADVPPRDF